MSACDKFKVGDYVNVSAAYARSFRFDTELGGEFVAGRVVGWTRNPYAMRLQLAGDTSRSVMAHMDDWEVP